MKSLMIMLAVAAASFPSISQANCVASGTVPRIFVTGSGTNIGVRDNGAGTTFFNFTTTSGPFISAALSAEASHMTLTITGNAAGCSSPVGGLSQGGAILTILVSP
jgi:hypothetical protein